MHTYMGASTSKIDNTSKVELNNKKKLNKICYECAEQINEYEYGECFNCRAILHLKCIRNDYRCNCCLKERMLYRMK